MGHGEGHALATDGPARDPTPLLRFSLMPRTRRTSPSAAYAAKVIPMKPGLATAEQTAMDVVDEADLDPPRGEAARDESGHPLRAGDELGRVELQHRLSGYLRSGRARVVLTDNVHTMVTVRRGQGITTFRLHHMFLEAPSVVVRAIARYAETHDRASAELVRDYIDANDQLIRRESGRSEAVDVEGKYHNLQAIFDDLNERYFDGEIAATITWGQRSRRRRGRQSIKLGSYTFEDRLIRIHPVLDARDVPEYFVASVIYHEMLHEVFGSGPEGGRRCYHPPAFRDAEAHYEHHAAAQEWERGNLHKLLDR